MRCASCIITIALAGCSILVPGPGDFTYDLADAGADGGADAGAPIDAGDRDGGTETDAGSTDAGCATGERSCGGACVDVQNSNEHCGRCDGTCEPGWICREGGCHDDPVQVSSGPSHTCVRLASASLYCWGANDTGQLGAGDFTASSTPRRVMEVDDAVHVSAGGSPFGGFTGNTCAARRSGEVWCWGRNDAGQVGDGTMDTRNRPVRVVGVSGGLSVEVGLVSTCALLTALPRLVCWGDGASPEPVPGAPIGAPIDQLAVGATHACVLSEGRVHCWGNNAAGQLGDGSTTNRSTAFPVPGLEDIVEIAVSLASTCARASSGRVWCWGREDLLGLGRTSMSAEPDPQEVSALAGASRLYAGEFASGMCAADPGGDVSCWGKDLAETVRVGSDVYASTPTPLSALRGTTSLSIGVSHACAVIDRRVVCWGANGSGQIGNGSNDPSVDPTAVLGLS